MILLIAAENRSARCFMLILIEHTHTRHTHTQYKGVEIIDFFSDACLFIVAKKNITLFQKTFLKHFSKKHLRIVGIFRALSRPFIGAKLSLCLLKALQLQMLPTRTQTLIKRVFYTFLAGFFFVIIINAFVILLCVRLMLLILCC